MYPRGDKAGTDEQACMSFPQHWKREDEKKRKGIRKDEEEKRKAEEKIRKQEEEKRNEDFGIRKQQNKMEKVLVKLKAYEVSKIQGINPTIVSYWYTYSKKKDWFILFSVFLTISL